MALNGFDLAFLMLAFLSVAFGAWRGFVFESINVLGWVVGFFAAMGLGPLVGGWLPGGESLGEGVRRVLGMLAVFVVAIFVSSLLASLGRRSVRALGMGAADRLVGALFGVARILLVGVAVAVIVHALQWQDSPWWASSASGPWLDVARQELAALLPSWKILQPPSAALVVPAGAMPQVLHGLPSASP
ncbi:CvpA family protein [Lampropedia cohaerens]|uniref:CvpA family protein n=1 Tax=Lampropedia cohaerens TaxID=1610491 RepID=UPI0012E37231|nr:CvpA family protein [Lampropedia cohaerens]